MDKILQEIERVARRMVEDVERKAAKEVEDNRLALRRSAMIVYGD